MSVGDGALNAEDSRPFEDLLLELSVRFANVAPDQLDGQIRDLQRTFCERMGLDRSSLWQVSPEAPDSLVLTHIHGTEFGPPPPMPMKGTEYFPWTYRRAYVARQVLIVSSLSQLPPEAARDAESYRRFGTKATVVIPLESGGEPPVGLLTFAAYSEREWPEQVIRRAQMVAHLFGGALVRRQAELRLRASLEELRRLRDQLQDENSYFRGIVTKVAGEEAIVGESDAIRRTLAAVRRVAPLGTTVLITGETGTGKELVAEAIHAMSPRARRPLIKVNCAALPATLIESELFGRERGAYTGAMTRQAGRFELANGSTLFLDEVSELPLELQVKLLRVIETGEFERLGGSQTHRVDVRLIAATNRDLSVLVKEGRFRADLYYRLDVFPIVVPPLRERAEDVPLLTWGFVHDFSRQMGKQIESIPKAHLAQLSRYAWPGNVRELRNLVERAMILADGPVLRITSPDGDAPTSPHPETLGDVERRHIRTVLDRTGWKISGKGGAASALGLVPTTLHSKMKKLGISRPNGSTD